LMHVAAVKWIVVPPRCVRAMRAGFGSRFAHAQAVCRMRATWRRCALDPVFDWVYNPATFSTAFRVSINEFRGPLTHRRVRFPAVGTACCGQTREAQRGPSPICCLLPGRLFEEQGVGAIWPICRPAVR